MPPPSQTERVLADLNAGETPLSAKRVATHPLVAIDGRPRHIAWVYRMWESKRLAYAKVGTLRVCTHSEIVRFVRSCSGAGERPAVPDPDRAHLQAERELVAAGF